LVDQRPKALQDGGVDAAYSLSRLERPAACEHAELREERLGILLEQVVAPVEGHAQRLLMLRCVPSAAGEEREPIRQPPEERGRRKEFGSRRRELDRKRQTVKARTELGHGGRVLLAQLEVRVRSLSA